MSTLMNVPKNGQTIKNSNVANRGWNNWLDDLFSTDPFPSAFTTRANTVISLPKVNIKETKDNYFVELAVPGMKKDDFNIDLENKVLSISTEYKEESENTENNYTRREFGYAAFKRTFSLPESIDDGKIKATYTDGILTIQLPKREEAKEKPARTIEIS